MINYDKSSDFGYTLVVDAGYPKYQQALHTDVPFLPEKIVINKEKNSSCSFHNNRNYNSHIFPISFKTQIISRKSTHGRSTQLKLYINLNTKYKAKARNDFEQNQYRILNNSVFGKKFNILENKET